MLAKLERNKFLLLFLFIFLFACKEKVYNSTTAICPDGKILLLKDMSISDVKNSLQKAIQEKQNYNYATNYSVISNGESSIMLNSIKPEELNRCKLENSSYRRSYKKFVRTFKR